MNGRIWLVALALASCAGAAQAQCRTDSRVDWRVEGRFRLTDYDAEGRTRTDALLEQIRSDQGGRSMSEAYDQIIASVVATPDHTGLYEHTFYDRRTETYRRTTPDGRSFLAADADDIRIRVPAQTGACRWSAGESSGTFDCAVGETVRIPRSETPMPVTVTLPGGGTADACVQVRDTLVLAFGDSFAAGEGNPDRPADWAQLPDPRYRPRGRSEIDWWSKRPGLPALASAQWWDNTCHRSLLSQHAQAAIAMAARDPHGVVTFVSFACSGGTVLDGFVAPRSSSPGGYRAVGGERGSTAHRQSQINQAVTLLCAEFDAAAPYTILEIPQEARHWNRLLRGARREAGQARTEVAVRNCRRWIRRPDVILNSLGGNDVGFAGVATWAVVPPAGRSLFSLTPVVNGLPALTAPNGLGLVCPVPIPGQSRYREPYAEHLLRTDLPPMLRLANAALDASGLTGPETVRVHSPYPSILRDSEGELCGGEWTVDGPVVLETDEGLMRQREPWLAQFTRIPLAGPNRWSFGFANHRNFVDCVEPTPDRIQLREACVMETRVWRPLNETVTREMATTGWRVVEIGRFGTRNGVCAYSPPDGDLAAYNREFGWPRWTGTDWAAGYPRPQDWRPYVRRDGGRWFRTANDSALTQMVAGRGSDGRDEAVSGTVHPTAQAHAKMADLIAEALAR